MHQLKDTKVPQIRIELAIRALCLSLLLMGNAFIFVSTMTSNQVFAQGLPKMNRKHVAALHPLAITSTKNRLQPERHTAPQIQKGHIGSHLASPKSSKKNSLTVKKAAGLVDVGIATSVQGGPTFQVGQTLTFNIVVTNISATTTLNSTSGVTALDIIPLGLNNITTTSSGWSITVTSSNGPASLGGVYSGSPVAPGGEFPTIQVSGVLTSNAIPVFTNTAGVFDNTNPNTQFATFSVTVLPASPTNVPTATPTTVPTTVPTLPITPTETITPTVTITSTATATSDLSIGFNAHGGPTYQVGQTFTFDVVITNVSTRTLDSTSGVGIGVLVPGLTNIAISGSGWTVVSISPNSPIVIKANYIGASVNPGMTFAAFEISGTLTPDAVPTFTATAGGADTENPAVDLTSFSVGVSLATPTAIPTDTVTPTATVATNLSVSLTASGGPAYQVGQTVTFTAVVTNTSSTTTLDASSGVNLGDFFPAGISNIVVTGSDWTAITTGTDGPALLKNSYNGPPVAPGATFQPLEFSGTLTQAAVPTFPNSVGTFDTEFPTIIVQSLNLDVTPATPTPPVTPTITTNLSVGVTVSGGPVYQVGQTVNFVETVQNISATTTLDSTSGVLAGDLFPAGISNIVTTGSGWDPISTGTDGPVAIKYGYSGPPVPPGGFFPTIQFSGTLTQAAVPVFANAVGAFDAEFATHFVIQEVSLNVVPMTPTPTPSFLIIKTHVGSSTASVGQPITYSLSTLNLPSAGAESTSYSIVVTDVIPAGLSAITASGFNWNVAINSTVSPAIMTATYVGSYPVSPGTTLPQITLSGLLNPAAVPVFTNTASITAAGDPNPSLDTSVDSVTVSPSDVTPTVTVTPTETITPTVTVTPTETITPTVSVTPTETITPTVSVTPIETVTPTVSITPTETITPTVTATATVTSTATVIPTATPAFLITKTHTGGDTFTVGQTMSYTLVTMDMPGAGPESTPDSVVVTDVVPAGLTDLTATGFHWNIAVSSTTGPAIMTATYIGTYPVLPGTVLPQISLSGVITPAAVPVCTNTASVAAAGDPNPSINTSVDSVTVLSADVTPSATVMPTETVTATRTVIPTETVTPVAGNPDLFIDETNGGGGDTNTFVVGHKVTYIMVMGNSASAGSVVSPNTITMSDIIPVGLKKIHAEGRDWSFSLSSDTSPALLTATYTGSLPMNPGQFMPAIFVSGVLTDDAVSSLTTTAMVDTQYDADTSNNTAIDTVFVNEVHHDHQSNSDNQHGQQDNQHQNQQNNNDQQQNDNNQQNNNQQNNNNNNNNNSSSSSSSSSSSYPGLPPTGSDPS